MYRILAIFLINIALYADDFPAFVIALKPRTDNLKETLQNLETFTPVTTKRPIWYADPMLFKHKGQNYMFFEKWPLSTRKGIISCMTIGEDFSLSTPQDVLEETFHLSFPYVFEQDNEIYMIPETYDVKEIRLYKAIEFPHKWQKDITLISGEKKFSDPTIYFHNNYYWLIASVDMYTLVVFYSTSLKGPYIPHPINKKKLLGRNAGGIFKYNNNLIRPVMDCRKGYGHSMELRKIVSLSPTKFKEKVIARIEPNWLPELEGTHTFSVTDELVAYDGYLNHSELLKHIHDFIDF